MTLSCPSALHNFETNAAGDVRCRRLEQYSGDEPLAECPPGYVEDIDPNIPFSLRNFDMPRPDMCVARAFPGPPLRRWCASAESNYVVMDGPDRCTRILPEQIAPPIMTFVQGSIP